VRALLAAVLGLVLALGSSFVAAGTAVVVYPDILGCERGCTVVASGWPLRYARDYPGLSVVGRTDAFEAWLGGDRLDLVPFAVDWGLWIAIAGALLALIGRRKKRDPGSSPE
jgi:hypothetical protein